MNDRELIDSLHYLGIDERNCRVIALLPLVQVAWADGHLQAPERTAILRIAKQGAYADAESERVLNAWLANMPSEAYFARGHSVIVELAKRSGGLDSGVTGETIGAILGYCEVVASAAGGFFGLIFAVDASERKAMADIALALHIDPTEGGWTELAEESS